MRSTRSRSWIDALLGASPLPVPPHVFALDGSRLVYAEFERRNGSVTLRDRRQVALPQETFAAGVLGGTVRDRDALGAALAGLLPDRRAVAEASLVLPDDWARIAFAEIADLPRNRQACDEVLRWKLRRMVPYRVEDLRLSYLEVLPLATQTEPRRVMLLFALESLLAELESIFGARGVRLGHVGNETLALLEAAGEALAPLDLAGLAHVREGGYSLVFTRQGKPSIYRFKALAAGDPQSRMRQVRRDLRLTRRYVADHLEGVRLRRLLLAGPAVDAAAWRPWLEESFEVPVTSLDEIVGTPLSLEEGIAPLAGAVARAT